MAFLCQLCEQEKTSLFITRKKLGKVKLPVCQNCVYPWQSNITDPWQMFLQIQPDFVKELSVNQVHHLLTENSNIILPTTKISSERKKFNIDKLLSFWNSHTLHYDFHIHLMKPMHRLRKNGFFKKWNRPAQNKFKTVLKTCLHTLLQHTVFKKGHLITHTQICATLNCLSIDSTVCERAILKQSEKAPVEFIHPPGLTLAIKKQFGELGIRSDAKQMLVYIGDFLAEKIHAAVVNVQQDASNGRMVNCCDVEKASENVACINTLLIIAK